MANTLGIPEATLAEARNIGSAVNGLGVTRERWNQRAVLRITDHAADEGVTGDETEQMAIFTNDIMHDTWVLGGAKRGGNPQQSAGNDQPTDPVIFVS